MNDVDLSFWEKKFEETLSGYTPTDPSHAHCHFKRVWKIASEISKHEQSVDLLVVLAGCYFHDFGSLPKNHQHKNKASTISAEKSVSFLKDLNFPEQKLSGVFHAIEAHSYSGGIPPQTIEAKIVQDADRIEGMGAIGIARIFTVGGDIGSLPFHSSDPLAKNREIDDSRYALDHILKKQFMLKNSLLTQGGRVLGERRSAFMHSYIDQLLTELSV